VVGGGAQAWWTACTVDAEETLSALDRAAKVVRDAGGVVAVVRHEADRRGDLVFGPGPDDVVVDAGGMSAFFAGPLDLRLRELGRDRLAVGGLGVETAVYSTLGAANDRGYECLALADAAAPHDPAVAERALASVIMSGGIFGAVGTTVDLCELLSKEAR
jgi:isochorismate hydrolase